MRTLRPLLLPALLVLNGVASLAIANRAASLRRAWQVWTVRVEAQARLKHLRNEDNHPEAGP
jgi:hypothetical protein